MPQTTNVPKANSKMIFNQIFHRLDQHDQQIKELKQQKMDKPKSSDITNKDLFNAMNSQFSLVDHRFDSVNHHFESINQHFVNDDKKFDNIVNTIMTMNTNMNKRFNRMFYLQMGTIITILIASITLLAKLGTF